MGTFALLASLAFSVVALRVENRREKDLSWAMLLPTVWYILSVSKPIDYWLNPALLQQTSQDYMEGSPNTRIVLMALMVCGLLVLCVRTIDWVMIFRRNRFFWVLLVFMLASLAWSDYRYVALKRYVRLVGDIVMVMIILTEKEPIEATKKMVLNSAYLLVPLSIVLAKYFPIYGREYNYTGTTVMWTGVASQKNGLGIFCAITVLTALSVITGSRTYGKARARNNFRLMLLCLSAYTLAGGGESYPSSTALTVVPVGVVVLIAVLMTGNTPLGRGKFTAQLVLVAIAVLVGFRSPLRDALFGLLGRDPTLTGRDVIWSGLIEIGMEHPVAGVGFGSFWMMPILGVNQAHNGYIEIFLQLGVLGIVLMGVFLVEAYIHMWTGDTHDTAYRVMMFVVVLVQNYSEASLLRANSSAGIIFLMVSVCLIKRDSAVAVIHVTPSAGMVEFRRPPA